MTAFRPTLWLVLMSALVVLPSCGGEAIVRPECRVPTVRGELGTLCGFQNPEDLVYFHSAKTLVTAEFDVGGAIVAFSPGDPSPNPEILKLWPQDDAVHRTADPPVGDTDCRAPPSPTAFHPHGLGSLEVPGGSNQLAVVSHGDPETIQLFELMGEWPAVSLIWRGCVPLPPRATGNDVALDADGTIFATNWAPSRSGLSGIYYLIKGAFGRTTGGVLRWKASQGWQSVPGAEGALPNGIIFSADHRVLYVADGGRQRVLAIDASSEVERAAEPLEVLGNPDNLSLTSDGRILTVSFNREGDLSILCLGQNHACRVGWRVVAIDPETGDREVLFEHNGSALSMATGAVLIGDLLFIGSMADDRVGVRRISSPSQSTAPASLTGE